MIIYTAFLEWHLPSKPDIQQLHFLLPAGHGGFSRADVVSFSDAGFDRSAMLLALAV